MAYLQVRLVAAPCCRSAALMIGDSSRCPARQTGRASSLLCATLLALIALQIAPAAAQVPTPTGNLTALMQSGIYAYNGLEIAAARTNDAAYGVLLADNCGAVAGVAAPPPATCSASQTQLFNRLRELEDTANSLLGRGETTYSLRLGAQAVGFALRWTAPEEYAAQGSLTNKFANNQLTTLTGRFSALRFAGQIKLARGADEASESDSDAPRLSYYGSRPLGGGASADSNPFPTSNWGVFANGSYSAGKKAPTTFEDAFDYNDSEYSGGTDVRLNRHVVVGLLAGHTFKNVNFNSSESIVAGGIRGAGYSAIAYAQFEWDAPYINLSVGFQHLALDTRRSITYPSLNPLIPSVNETSTSSATATSFIANVGAGYSFHWRGFSAEPYLNTQYVDTKIAAFTEHGGNGFDTDVASQSIPSLTSAAGLKLQQAFLPPFGVIVPYIYGEYRHEFMENSRSVNTTYAGTTVSAADFSLPTDAPTRSYYAAGGGLTVVLKHGLQGFLQYVKVFGLTNYSDYVASGGIRYEF
ncbi:MAG TPA: autotransporter outer membrane beta-barrel domain-containing protein [Steroidobacteraceae bacterium]|nr:autotransporter outer membrane beta-barrel domain-containing protein [Steroidobacteraceae bacterium]